MNSGIDKFYDVNGDIVNINLEYNDFSELLDEKFSYTKRINPEFFSYLHELIKPLPARFKININLTFNNSNYSTEEIGSIILENILFNLSNFKRYSKRKVVRALSMLFGGLFCFGLYYVARYFSWYDLFIEIFNISAWVFIWESVTLYFIDLKFENLNYKFLKKHINEINIKLR